MSQKTQNTNTILRQKDKDCQVLYAVCVTPGESPAPPLGHEKIGLPF